jgi:O-antigen ligase
VGTSKQSTPPLSVRFGRPRHPASQAAAPVSTRSGMNAASSVAPFRVQSGPPLAAGPASAGMPGVWAVEVANPIRKVGLALTLFLLYVRLAGIPDLLAIQFGINTYILYWAGAPAVICLVFSDGLSRIRHWKPIFWWILFGVWLVFVVPFSDWTGGSLRLVATYLRADLLMLFLVAGLAMTWRECCRILAVMAAAAMTTVIIGIVFRGAVGSSNRLALSIATTMSDANDFGALLTFLLPFLVLVGLTPRRLPLIRAVVLIGFGYGLYLILSTGSRGALVGITGAALFALWRLSGLQRLWAAIAMLLIAAVVALALPSQIAERLLTFSDSGYYQGPNVDAAESAESRMYLLKKSLLFTVQHPLWGVGPGEFADHEGFGARAVGLHGNWHETHNSYTQISSEAGIPAAVFFVLALIATFRLLMQTHRAARSKAATPINRQISLSVTCVMTAMVGFCVAAAFLSLGYRFYFPLLSGVAIIISRAAESEWLQSSSAAGIPVGSNP